MKTISDDRHDIVKPKVPLPPKKQNFFPLGKPKQRPPFRPNKPTSNESPDVSFLDFLPFWKSGQQVKPKRPIGPPPPRPVGPKVTKLEHKPDYPKGLQALLLV